MTPHEQFNFDGISRDRDYAVTLIQTALADLEGLNLMHPDPFVIVGVKRVLGLAKRHMPDTWAKVEAECAAKAERLRAIGEAQKRGAAHEDV